MKYKPRATSAVLCSSVVIFSIHKRFLYALFCARVVWNNHRTTKEPYGRTHSQGSIESVPRQRRLVGHLQASDLARSHHRQAGTPGAPRTGYQRSEGGRTPCRRAVFLRAARRKVYKWLMHFVSQ